MAANRRLGTVSSGVSIQAVRMGRFVAVMGRSRRVNARKMEGKLDMDL